MDKQMKEKIKRILADSPKLLITEVTGEVYFQSLPKGEIAEIAALASESGELVFLIPTVKDYQEYVLWFTGSLPKMYEDDIVTEI